MISAGETDDAKAAFLLALIIAWAAAPASAAERSRPASKAPVKVGKSVAMPRLATFPAPGTRGFSHKGLPAVVFGQY